jgi:lysyl-tRNA synthetase class 2
MLEENALMRQRREKIAAARRAGDIAFPNDFTPNHTGADLHAQVRQHGLEPLDADRSPGQPIVRVAGRVMAINVKGKAAFIRLRDRSSADVLKARGDENTQRIQQGLEPRAADASTFQVYMQRQEDEVLFDRLFKGGDRSLDIGDIAGFSGRPFRTRMGEPSLQACTLDTEGGLLSGAEAGEACVRLLTKSVRPLPEKFHGLTDKETRFRQRYVDLTMNDDVREVFRRRALIVRGIRDFLDRQGYVEVETPMMHPVLGGAAARPFRTHHNALDMPLYLRIAPELYLKRLVVGGFERVYEINRNFRNEGLSQRHNPEFTMLEFYRAYATYDDLMVEVETMIAELAVAVTGATTVTWGKNADGTPRDIHLQAPFARVSIRDGLKQWAGLTEAELDDEQALRKKAVELGVHIDAHSSKGKIQVELFEAVGEPRLVQPTFVIDYPAETSPLARRNDLRPDYVDRFELFVGCIEISNAFSELNDPDDQYARFQMQLDQKAKGDEETMEMDLDYVRALEYGMPPTAGCGIGVDRLTMLLTDTDSIREVILFPHMRPEVQAGDKPVAQDAASLHSPGAAEVLAGSGEAV